ncbi:MAG: stage II sporulation protein M [Flavobacteriaceae bacterium]|nr:stage II sporulation protein M [Flavobacteriaceae bacterium]
MKYNLISIFIFLLGLIIGLFYFNNDLPNINTFESSNSNTLNLKENLTLYNILYTNLKVVIINIFGGLTFGLLTSVNLLYNGIFLSYLLKVIYTIDTKLYLILLPHSMEFLGFILAGAIGIEIGLFLFNYIFLSKKIKLDFVKLLKKTIISILIIFVAGLIEVYVSPNII